MPHPVGDLIAPSYAPQGDAGYQGQTGSPGPPGLGEHGPPVSENLHSSDQAGYNAAVNLSSFAFGFC